VRYVLAGSVRRSGSRVRVNIQLIDAASDAHLWTERFERDTSDLFALQNEITGELANALGVELIAAEAARPIEHPDALDYMLRGRAVLLKPRTPEAHKEAIDLYERALALDPQFVEVQSRLAAVLVDSVTIGMTDSASTAASIARAAELVDRALAASPPQGSCAYRQRPCTARSKPMGGGYSRIRGGARIGSQLRLRIKQSRLVQALLRVDRRGHRARGASHSPQPS